MKIAVLLTCFNRKEKTNSCLHSLFKILQNVSVYLVDDGSTDGTSEEIRANFPDVTIIQGSGNLFWSRGMYTAWREAVKTDFDFYLWLNDDIVLYPGFFEKLLDVYNSTNGECIVSGLIENIHKKGEILYGGADFNKKLIQEGAMIQEIRFMNGNVVLVPKNVVKKIGIIDPVYHHDLGDVDYGLKAQMHGIKVYASKTAVAAGYPNGICRVRKWGTNVIDRFKRLQSPLGSRLSINIYFRKKYFGSFNAFAFASYLILLNILPDKVVEFIWKDQYKNKNAV